MNLLLLSLLLLLLCPLSQMEPKKLLKLSNTSFSRDDDVTAAMLMSQTKKLWLCIPTQSSQPIKRNLD